MAWITIKPIWRSFNPARKASKPVSLLLALCVPGTEGQLTLHFLRGYAPELNPDELVWSHAKRTGVAPSPLKAGEKLECRVENQSQSMANDIALVQSFFRHPSVRYIF